MSLAPVILVFARAPIPGACKTRLIPALGAAGAARLHARLLARALDEVSKVQQARAVLCADSEDSHKWLARYVLPRGWGLTVQRGQDLGLRMHHALVSGVSAASRVLLIGSDIVDFSADDLRQALGVLEDGADIVLGPAADGGYWLVGAGKPVPEALFTDLCWGGAGIFQETCRRCENLTLRWQAVSCRHDVDVPADLHLHQSRLAALTDPAWWVESQGDPAPVR